MDILLPTLRSRLALFPFFENASNENDVAQNASKAAGEKIATEFLRKSIKDRIAFVDGLAADIGDEKAAKHEALHFINQLETAIIIRIGEPAVEK